MSTKIWCGYRVKVSSLNLAIDFLSGAMFDRSYEKYSSMLVEFVERNKQKSPFSLKWELDRVLRNAAKGNEFDISDVSASLSVYILKDYAYIIPIQFGRIEGPEELPEWIEEYHYQNQADQPKTISRKSWLMRGRNWNRALKSPCLVHTVVGNDGTTLGELDMKFFREHKELMQIDAESAK